jgi:hypothetical protein
LIDRANLKQTERAGSESYGRIGSKAAMRIQSALILLLDAATFAQDAGSDLWDFSVEISALRDLGLTNTECRWIVANELASHACEMTHLDADRRTFQPCGNLSFTERTCFVITPRGTAQVQAVLRAGVRPSDEQRAPVTVQTVLAPRIIPTNGEVKPDLPSWDPDRQQLRVGGRIVKEFKVPAANQEAILAAFQEEGWVPRIDDPLPPNPNQDSKRRLHDTINSLNRHQKHSLLRFLGDGKGEGVRWEFANEVDSL